MTTLFAGPAPAQLPRMPRMEAASPLPSVAAAAVLAAFLVNTVGAQGE